MIFKNLKGFIYILTATMAYGMWGVYFRFFDEYGIQVFTVQFIRAVNIFENTLITYVKNGDIAIDIV